MKTIHMRLAMALLVTILLATACNTVVRENIISSVNTGIGVSIAENPQTQLYEIKAGYIRSQFYSIPTGKKVKTGKSTNDILISKDANVTPDLVSGIRVKSDIQHFLFGAEISENFVVGQSAVQSPAATAMYLAQADTTEKAQAAAQGLVTSSVMAWGRPRSQGNGEQDSLLG